MGIPGLLKEIGKGDRIALAKLAIEHFEKHNRPLRIAIDAAIWNFQHQAGQGGKNPALRTLFFRLLRLLTLPIHPVFVYDGRNKPLTKRGKTVTRYGTCVPNELSKTLVARFQFPHHTAPGEAEAECAFLQKNGIVDAVMSQDADAIMFGSTLTFRDWSKEGEKGNKSPTHVNVLTLTKIRELTGLDPAGMILVALLSGGDYNDGLPGFGPMVSCAIAKAGFATDLLDLVHREDEQGLREWRERLQYELETNESGYFQKRHRTLHIPDDFPNRTVLGYYLTPMVSKVQDLKNLESRWLQWWGKEIDIPDLRSYTAVTFDWLYKGGARKFIRCLAQPLFHHRLKMRRVGNMIFSEKPISEERKHFTTGGITELRFSIIPQDVVEVDVNAEEENPEYAELDEGLGDDEVDVGEPERAASPSKRSQRPPWDPSKVEKWWIPQSLLMLGLPDAVKDWEQEQRDIRSDPVKFATRRCRQPVSTGGKIPRRIDQSMKNGALEDYISKHKVASQPRKLPADDTRLQSQEVRSPKAMQTSKSNSLITHSFQNSSMQSYFNSAKDKQPDPSGRKTAHTLASAPDPKKESNISTKSFAVPSAISSRGGSLSRSRTVPLDTVNLLEPHENDRDPVSSETFRQERKSDRLDELEEVDVVFLSKQKALPEISSFFGQKAGVAKVKQLTYREVDGHLLAPVPHSLGPTSFAKKVAVSRDSLPGTWKEVPVTPSQKSRLSIIDLTDT